MIRTLGIDCGGSGLKASVLDEQGEMLAEHIRIKTPYPLPPERFVRTLTMLAKRLPEYDRVTVGRTDHDYPGCIRVKLAEGNDRWVPLKTTEPATV